MAASIERQSAAAFAGGGVGGTGGGKGSSAGRISSKGGRVVEGPVSDQAGMGGDTRQEQQQQDGGMPGKGPRPTRGMPAGGRATGRGGAQERGIGIRRGGRRSHGDSWGSER